MADDTMFSKMVHAVRLDFMLPVSKEVPFEFHSTVHTLDSRVLSVWYVIWDTALDKGGVGLQRK